MVRPVPTVPRGEARRRAARLLDLAIDRTCAVAQGGLSRAAGPRAEGPALGPLFHPGSDLRA